MKRLLLAPLLFLLVSCSSNNVNQPPAKRNPVSAISENVDEFDNSRKVKLTLTSEKKLTNNYGKLENALLSIGCTKNDPNSDSIYSGRYSVSLSVPSSIRISYVGNFADLKWDDEQPLTEEFKHSSGSYGDYAFFNHQTSKKIISKLVNYSTLKIRYITLNQGLQTAEFSLVGENNYYSYAVPIEEDISSLIKRCDELL